MGNWHKIGSIFCLLLSSADSQIKTDPNGESLIDDGDDDFSQNECESPHGEGEPSSRIMRWRGAFFVWLPDNSVLDALMRKHLKMFTLTPSGPSGGRRRSCPRQSSSPRRRRRLR